MQAALLFSHPDVAAAAQAKDSAPPGYWDAHDWEWRVVLGDVEALADEDDDMAFAFCARMERGPGPSTYAVNGMVAVMLEPGPGALVGTVVVWKEAWRRAGTLILRCQRSCHACWS